MKILISSIKMQFYLSNKIIIAMLAIMLQGDLKMDAPCLVAKAEILNLVNATNLIVRN